MDSTEEVAKQTFPYLSAHILSMAPCNTEGKWNWNSLESEIACLPIFFFREQAASELPKMLSKCSLINQPVQHPCEMDTCCCLHHFIHAESWACPGWCNKPAVGEGRTRHSKASISMLTSVIWDPMIQPEVWALPYITTVQVPLNREI